MGYPFKNGLPFKKNNKKLKKNKNGQEINRSSTKEDYWMISTQKDAQHLQLFGECKLKLQ